MPIMTVALSRFFHRLLLTNYFEPVNEGAITVRPFDVQVSDAANANNES